MITDLILGTAGHIDHGKTSLIKALTGTNTDRLPEEIKRGITIELGYAHLDLPPFRVGIVDVPGHEKFVRQMLAGATGMDLALLVIAGDDSIKQQTYEHLDILRLLNLRAGVIALTKSDLSDPEWLDLVESEIRQLVHGTFLEHAPIVRTSSKTGAGLEDLKAALLAACTSVAQNSTPTAATADSPNLTTESALTAPFRLAIDRAFSIAGYGTVVTGSVSSGSVNIGDQVEIQPGGSIARVRGLQNHDSQVATVHRGQRAAINLAGVSLQEIERGHELAAVGHLLPAELLTVRLRLLDRANKPLKDRTRIRFHIGTAELFGNVRLLEASELQPGETGLAQIFLNEPVVAVWNQPFVIRRQSPMETIGGGTVLHPNSYRLRKPSTDELAMLHELAGTDPHKRASAAAYFSDSSDWLPAELARTAGIIDVDGMYASLKSSGELVEVALTPSRNAVLQRQHLETLSQRLLKTLSRLHDEHPLRFAHPRSDLDAEFSYLSHPQWLNVVIELLKQRKQIVANVNSISLVGSGPKLSKGQKLLMEQLIDQFKSKGLLAPSVEDLEATAKKNKDSVVELLDLASENGELVKVSNDIYLHRDTMQSVHEKLTNALSASAGLTMSEIRQVLDTTRKYSVPLCEYCDRIGFTIRNGDIRILAPKRDFVGSTKP